MLNFLNSPASQGVGFFGLGGSFWECISKGASRVIFDHCPLLLEAGGFCWGCCAFKFENMWLKAEDFVERVQQWWNGYCFVGSPSFILAQKLKALKGDLKKCNREEFGDLAFRKKSLLSELLGLDAISEVWDLSNEE